LLEPLIVVATQTLERMNYKLSPASINAYYRCPQKFKFRYIRNVKMPFVFKPALVIGGVTHKALAELFRHRRDGLVPASAESYVDRYIRRERYPDDGGDALRIEHMPVILAQIDTALSALPQNAEIVDVEQEFTYQFHHAEIGANVTLAARVDLVIRHDEIVDHIDFKTGGQSGDPIQNLLSRVTVQHQYQVPSEQLRTVNIMTKSGEYQIVPGERDAHANTWHIVRREIGKLAVDTEWTARPDPAICRWCDFRPKCDYAADAVDDYDG
jgi:hypothetical protein